MACDAIPRDSSDENGGLVMDNCCYPPTCSGAACGREVQMERVALPSLAFGACQVRIRPSTSGQS